MEEKNLDIYGNSVIPWSRALAALEAPPTKPGEPGGPNTYWLATIRPDERPHIAGVGALWVDGNFYFVSGPGTRKSRNLAMNPNCVISVILNGIARVVTDEPTLQRLVKRYNAEGWPASVSNGAFTAEYSAPSAGPPPWNLYVMRPRTAFGVATADPPGATRWRFESTR